jgi:hypothetical protein
MVGRLELVSRLDHLLGIACRQSVL